MEFSFAPSNTDSGANSHQNWLVISFLSRIGDTLYLGQGWILLHRKLNMPRLVTGSLLAVFLIAAWAASRTGFAQDPAAPDKAEQEAGVPATETPAKKQPGAAD